MSERQKDFTVCHTLSNVELMQRLMQLFSSGGRGSYPNAASAAEAAAIFAELVERLDKR
jgi:hypothetical protein